VRLQAELDALPIMGTSQQRLKEGRWEIGDGRRMKRKDYRLNGKALCQIWIRD
jgi:hypothetical protein